MDSNEGIQAHAGFSFSSCVASDVWHPGKPPSGYEWWYFDALSDDGRESIVVIFLDNFIFSPRYNALNRLLRKTPSAGGDNSFPAVAFAYYKDGKPHIRTVTEFEAGDFYADAEWPSCGIGQSSFKFDSAPYGSGYSVNVRAELGGGRTLRADLEWLSVESDLRPARGNISEISEGHSWNMVCPRSDVTGKIEVISGRDTSEEINFRGTGYHDHNLDTRWLPDTVSEWTWGRAHFAGSTAVFYDFKGADPDEYFSKLLLVKDEGITESDAVFKVAEKARDKFGLRYPKRLVIQANDGTELEIKQKRVMDSSFFYTRFLCEAVLKSDGVEAKRSCGISEYLAPATLRKGWFDPLIDMRIGRRGKPSFLT